MIFYTRKHKEAFIVDDEDAEKVKKHTWHIRSGHVVTNNSDGDGAIYLQRLVKGEPPPGYRWTHKNGDHLDNRKDNIGLRNYDRERTPLTKRDLKMILLDLKQIPEGETVEEIFNPNFVVPVGVKREDLDKL
jgi:hypothetical protein